MLKAYLDTSTIVKRYVREKGSSASSLVYSMADEGELTITFSIRNMGEAVGVIDRYEQKGWINVEES